MIAVAPLFIRNDSIDWTNESLLSIVSSYLQAVKKAGIAKCHLFTDTETLAGHLPSLDGWLTMHVTDSAPDQDFLHMIEALCEQLPLQGEHVLGMNMKTPLLDLDQIDEFVTRYNDKQMPTISVRAAEDNPYQLLQYEQYIGGGTLLFLETDAEIIRRIRTMTGLKKCPVSKRFPFNWQRTDGADVGKLYSPTPHSGVLSAIDSHPADHPNPEIWICESPQTARVCWPVLSGPPSLLAVECGSSDTRLTVHHVKGKLVFQSDTLVATLAAQFFEESTVSTEVLTVTLPGGTTDIATERTIGQTGILYSASRIITEGEYSSCRNFIQNGTLWAGGCRTSDGKKIYGRQTLPEVFEADQSLIAFHFVKAGTLHRIIEDNATQGVVMRGPAIALDTELDILRYTILAEPEAQDEN